MRGLLAHADLARYAGQFVWLEINYDAAENGAFLTKYGAHSTPTFFVIDPQDERVAATQTGAMSLSELDQFLDRGASAALAKRQTLADAALTRGDSVLSRQPAEAAKAYRAALNAAPANWPRYALAEASLAGALQDSKEYQRCAETAVAEASHMNRDSMFARTVVAGMWCVASVDPAPWADLASKKLEALAEEALRLPTTVRDHRDELYRTLMLISVNHNDRVSAAKWGNRWLAELDAIEPRDDDERSAIDIARVEDVQTFGDPNRILPALLASEQTMPHNYNASLRVAQMESAINNYREAVAACERGLARSPGPDMRAWLLNIKADGLTKEGKVAEARRANEEGLQAAQAIPQESMRQMYIGIFEKQLGNTGGKQSPEMK
ncbi:MAG TPA: thioredoxin family protein [Candidatus Acidoferrales bacterium]|nr:thioredoxin family protein [Candidatus Acidoferrales bacterium]